MAINDSKLRGVIKYTIVTDDGGKPMTKLLETTWGEAKRALMEDRRYTVTYKGFSHVGDTYIDAMLQLVRWRSLARDATNMHEELFDILSSYIIERDVSISVL